jgi:hypothetical protein
LRVKYQKVARTLSKVHTDVCREGFITGGAFKREGSTQSKTERDRHKPHSKIVFGLNSRIVGVSKELRNAKACLQRLKKTP